MNIKRRLYDYMPIVVVSGLTVFMVGSLMAGSWIVGHRYGQAMVCVATVAESAAQSLEGIRATSVEVRDLLCPIRGCE